MGDAVVPAARDGLPLASVTGKSGAHYTTELRAAVPLEREGGRALAGAGATICCASLIIQS